jgi:hypothetical protein
MISRRWVDVTPVIDCCDAWRRCSFCLAELEEGRNLCWQEGRDLLADLKPTRPWTPHLRGHS